MSTKSSPDKPAKGVVQLWLDRILCQDVMGFLAIVALGMAAQDLFFGEPENVHHFIYICQIVIFCIFFAEYVKSFYYAPDRLKFVSKFSRMFDVLILLLVSLSFLPDVDNQMMHTQAFQIFRVAPVLFFGYFGTKNLSLQIISEEPEPKVEGVEFFRIQETESAFTQEVVGQDEALAWLSNPQREGFYLCKGRVTDALANTLSNSSIPPSLLINALSESSFPRALKVGNIYVFAGAIPHFVPNEFGYNSIIRTRFVAVFTAASTLLIRSEGVTVADKLFTLIKREASFTNQPPAFHVFAGVLKLVMDHYENASSEIESQLRKIEFEPLGKSSGALYQRMYLMRRTLSSLKSDLWRLRHILDGIEDGRRKTIFNDSHEQDFFTLMSHTADFLHEMFEELDDKAGALLDLRINLVSFKMNRFMGLLAVVTTLGLIPSTFGAFLGMNVDGGNFAISLGNVGFLCGMLILGVLYLFKINGWLKFQ